MKKILITGGPVHAQLDAVKIITNRFKGGLMASLANDLRAFDAHITYLCAPSVGATAPKPGKRLSVIAHTGLDDYRRKVRELVPKMDGVVLGAAVANLVPVKPWVGKFPSHNYRPGDTIPIDFKIAPRIIDDVKRIAPRTHLFGYKLLSGADRNELITAAYGLVLGSGATAVFANDTDDLRQKYAVTKERGIHALKQSQLARWIWTILNDVYYSTQLDSPTGLRRPDTKRLRSILEEHADKFKANEAGLVFGTVAVRQEKGFLTTGRGKRELDSTSHVTKVDHRRRQVYVAGKQKASLNAPLLDKIFDNRAVDYIVHYHQQVPGLPTLDYAPPGTVRDSFRGYTRSFNIRSHGCILLFDSAGKRL